MTESTFSANGTERFQVSVFWAMAGIENTRAEIYARMAVFYIGQVIFFV
jgi:hypothetical protein